MGIGDMVNKAKEFAKDNSEQAEKGIDAVAEQIKDRVPDQHDAAVDQAADAARRQLGLDGSGER